MAIYYDSYNHGSANFLNGTDPNGDIFYLGLGYDECTGAGNDTFIVSGGLNVPSYENQFQCSGTNNIIYLEGVDTDLWLGSFGPSDNIQTIEGGSYNNLIYASEYPGAWGQSLDFSATSLVGIQEIRGTDYGDYITGSGQYITGTTTPIPIIGGRGNDTFFESGPDTATETCGVDKIDGGAGNNVYFANGPLSSYTPAYNLDGTYVFHSGTTWTFTDAAGYAIELTNIQTVYFSDQTLHVASDDRRWDSKCHNLQCSDARHSLNHFRIDTSRCRRLRLGYNGLFARYRRRGDCEESNCDFGYSCRPQGS